MNSSMPCFLFCQKNLQSSSLLLYWIPLEKKQFPIISLPVEIRAQLVDKLLRSLHPVQKEIDELWAAEAEKRVEEIKSGKVKTIPGDKVFSKIFGR